MDTCNERTRCRISWAILTALLVPSWVGAQTDGARGTLSLDSRYLAGSYSNDAIAGFGVDVLNLAALPAELIEPSTRLRNAGRGVLVLVGSTIVGQAFSLAYHEYGHGTRAAAAGMKPRYGFGLISTDAQVQDALRAPPEYESFFSYFLGSLFTDYGYTLATLDDSLFPPLTQDELVETGWNVLLASGGLNNEMLLTERIEDEAYRNRVHIGVITTYFNSKLSASHYDFGGPFGDVGNTVTSYRAMGFDIDGDRIDSASRTSLFMSSMSYQLIYQTVRMFTGKPIRFRGWEPGGVQLPNTSFFMTRSGLSYRVRTGYRTGAWRFPLAVERVFEGDERTEVSIGAERGLERMHLRARATVGEGIGVALGASYRIRQRVDLSAGYALYDSRNLLGERLIPSLEHGSKYHDLFLRLSISY